MEYLGENSAMGSRRGEDEDMILQTIGSDASENKALLAGWL
jgi:hypothetical protein